MADPKYQFPYRWSTVGPLLFPNPTPEQQQALSLLDQKDRDAEDHWGGAGGGATLAYYGAIGTFVTGGDGAGGLSSDSVHVPFAGAGNTILYWATADVLSTTGGPYAGDANILVQPDDFVTGESQWSVVGDTAAQVQFGKIAFQGQIADSAIAGDVDLYLSVDDSGGVDPQEIRNGFITVLIVPTVSLPTF